jgi:hypothetical protein
MLVLATIAAALVLPASVRGESGGLEAPKGRVVLTISGNISRTNKGNTAVFDIEMLEKIGIKTIETGTPWTDGVSTFEGVLARDLMHAVGAKGDTVLATALNDYFVEIPMSDFDDYDVILAFRMNGERLRVRDKGPIWVLYPFSSVSEIQSTLFYSRAIWQLKSMDVR